MEKEENDKNEILQLYEKLQKELDRLEDELRAEQERNKMLQEDMESTLHDIQNI